MQEICSNMQNQICMIQHEYVEKSKKKYAIYVHNKLNYAKICTNKIRKYMQIYHEHKYAQTMHEYVKPNMHKYEVSKCA